MTNQDAIKILRKMETKLSEHLTGCMEVDVEIVEKLDAIDVAIDALEQDQNTEGWIPVREKLPEDGEEVLVSGYGHSYNKRVVISRYQGEQYGFMCGLVSAWMPLPKPYEPQESETAGKDDGMNTFDCGEVCCECCSRDICIHMTADKDDTTTDTENLIIEAAHNTENRRDWFRAVRNEIEELAEFHSVDIPVVYGDGEESTDKMVSLEELEQILSVIEDATDTEKQKHCD